MCDSFMLQKMENYQGDLADVIRSGGGGPISGTLGTTTTTTSSSSKLPPTIHNWQFSQPSDPMAYDHADDFGHPFSNIRDPLQLEELDSTFFTSSNSIDHHPDNSSGFSCGASSSNIFVGENNTTNINIEDRQEDQMKRAATPCNTSNGNCNNNIFSRVLHISPHIISDVKLPTSSCKSPLTVRPRIGIKPPPSSAQPSNSILICNDRANNNMIDSTGVQISSPPRNTGVKRRKSQAKKVVCIPAPAPVNSRPTGEIVPSDLWAWRKYGQKPIKGSPYPRGYYRCSSSKGCSARKQVERSRTDPNMLVITYTSEHNHPWPTQRNALAGSTRSTQPTKTINTKVHSPASLSQKQPLPTSNEQQQQQQHIVLEKDNNNIVDSVSASIDVKEVGMDDYEEKETIEMDKKINGEQSGFPNHDDHQNTYRPGMLNSIISHADQDFFADLEEIQADPLKLLFTQGFDEEERGGNNKAVASLDPFSFYDWTGNSNNNNFTSFGDQAKRGL